MSLTTQTLPASPSPGLFASIEKHKALVCLLLAVVTLALYRPVDRHPFLNYDDDRYVTENPHVRQGLTANTVRWAITSTEQANWHPLTWMSHALDYSLFRLNPAGHHFTSIVLHAVNVVLLFLLLIWGTRQAGPSLFVACLFSLHPMNVESVAWVAERKNVLCTAFFFLTLWAYGWYTRKPSGKRYAVVAGVFIAGLASKPMVITLPLVLLLLDYWPLQRMPRRTDEGEPHLSWPRLVAEKIPLLALSAASAVITMKAQRAGGAVRTTADFSLPVRIANAIYAYATYLWKAFWPAHLAPLYPHPGSSLAIWRVLLAFVFLALVTVLVCRFCSHGYLPVGWFWFLGTLVPVLGLVQVGEAAMADRYGYIPLIGIFVMIAFGIADLAHERNVGHWLLVPAAATLLALAFATHRQIRYWQSSCDLWSHTLAVTNSNFVAEDNLGGALILAGKEDEAYTHFAVAASINPRDPMSHSNLGTYFQNHNRLQEAIREYQSAISLTSDPNLLAATYANLGAAQVAVREDQQAANSFAQALRYSPNQFNAWLGLGSLARQHGNFRGAIAALARSIQIQPTAEGYLELGRTLAAIGRNTEALAAYQLALKISPGLSGAEQAAQALGQQKQ